MKTPKLYLLSGNGSMATWWQYTEPYFSVYKPVALDLPGFGNNLSQPCKSMQCITDALLTLTEPGNTIVACGVNCLPVLHAAVKCPDHFKKIILYGPIGAFLWQRKLPGLLSHWITQQGARFLLGHFPKLFKHLFATKTWSDDKHDLVAEGYRRCHAFGHYFNFVKAHSALTLLDTIETDVVILWGLKDKIADPKHAAAWEAILPRANLAFFLHPQWGHYPYIEDPLSFVRTIEKNDIGFRAHTKAGRLLLATTAGLNVPQFEVIRKGIYVQDLESLSSDADRLWSIRSSLVNEDQLLRSNAGLSKTYLEVPTRQVREKVDELLVTGGEVIIQQFIKPKVSGVAFVRHLGTEIEWVEGHLNNLVQGQANPQRAVFSRMGDSWQQTEDPMNTYGMNINACLEFLQSIIRAFHYAHLDIEWAWDGEQFYLLQLRPVTVYAWRRNLTAANISEILPSKPSRLIEWAQRRASTSIPHIYALWDTEVLTDNEPFTCTYKNASYINSDLFLARLKQWGLPSKLYAKTIGGNAPYYTGNITRFVKSLPVFIRMLIAGRVEIRNIFPKLKEFEYELDSILGYSSEIRREALVNWFLRFYVFVVQSNIIISTTITSSLGNWYKRTIHAYKNLNDQQSAHRVAYETDPGAPRIQCAVSEIPYPPPLSFLDRLHDRLCLSGNANHYIEVREWFRDSYTRLYHKLHNGLWHFEQADPHWFKEHPYPREQKGSFWQDNGNATQQTNAFVIYPGYVQGVVGKDILITDSLDPGQYNYYQTFKAVIARMGGRLSHGAILLRELQIPSAIIPNTPKINDGAVICLDHCSITIRTPHCSQRQVEILNQCAR